MLVEALLISHWEIVQQHTVGKPGFMYKYCPITAVMSWNCLMKIMKIHLSFYKASTKQIEKLAAGFM